MNDARAISTKRQRGQHVRIEPTDSGHPQQPSHPTVRAALLMIGVALAIVVVAAAGAIR